MWYSIQKYFTLYNDQIRDWVIDTDSVVWSLKFIFLMCTQNNRPISIIFFIFNLKDYFKLHSLLHDYIALLYSRFF